LSAACWTLPRRVSALLGLIGLVIMTVLITSCVESEPPPVAAGGAAPPDGATPVPESPPERHVFRALWVLCEGSARTLAEPSRIDALIEHSTSLEVTDLFVQVYRSGRAWYESSLADPAPYRSIVERSGADPLRRLIDRAHASGIRVHAWVNVFSLNANRSAPILTDLGEAAVMVDRRGRSLLDYPSGEVPAPDRSWYRMGTPGLYLDPGAPGVRERLVATFVELVDRYPDLDGLHLDYVRHPGVLPFAPGSRFGVGLDFGYGAATRERFRLETQLGGPYRDPANPSTSSIAHASAWDAWRRDQVTGLVRDLREAVLAEHVDLLLSAAVIAYADRAYLSLAQDWRGWIREGLLDFAVPMVYTLDDDLFRYQVEAFAKGPDAGRIWMGTGTWLFSREPDRALAQLATIRSAESTGEAIFSYDALLESEALMTSLRDGPAAPVPAAPDEAGPEPTS
jgi:uncharacterized lipoprotein YddW (UPF0748 family)